MLSSYALFSQKKESKQYSENLNKVRPTYTFSSDSLFIHDDTLMQNEDPLITSYAKTHEINLVLDSIASLNKNITYIRGYKVLVFSGNSQEEALEVRKKILELFEEIPEFKNEKVDFIYHQPMFRIKVGEYTNRLEAVRMSEFLKQQKFDFGEESEISINPLVVPDNIEIRK